MADGEQKLTEWQPDMRQIKIIELLVNPDDKRSKSDKIAEIGVSRTTFYEWMKDKRFVAYINSQIERYTDGEMPDVWKALMRKCKMGDIAAIKLFFEMKGMYFEKKKLEIGGTLNHTAIDLSNVPIAEINKQLALLEQAESDRK